LVLAALTWWAGKRLAGRMADAIEANALNGGRLSMGGSLYITLQTFISNACGASVGLEAAYTQISCACASVFGRGLAARRMDMRLLVGCGAAGAIAAAFGAPLAGAFYAFEVVLGAYSVGSLVPVAASAIVASFVSKPLIGHDLLVMPAAMETLQLADYGHVMGLAVIVALATVALMRGVAVVDTLFSKTSLPVALRPLIGGVFVGGMAVITPQVMGSGHGALAHNLAQSTPLLILASVILLKAMASAVSLGAGYRGGLFFASLLLGCMMGRLYVEGVSQLIPINLSVGTAAVAAMAAFGTGVLGSPVTMTVLALEMTGNFDVTAASFMACAISALIVRTIFGYSFATWRFHLRGETIRGPADVGWMRELTVAKLMRKDARSLPQDVTIAAARDLFPQGGERQFFLLNKEGHYAGTVLTADLHLTPLPAGGSVAQLALPNGVCLTPQMAIREALDIFERSETDVLPVLDEPGQGHVLGLLTEAHALRRYGEELERRHQAVIRG
jgi:CIC family chloride channel protein